jgi:hypothetical protein
MLSIEGMCMGWFQRQVRVLKMGSSAPTRWACWLTMGKTSWFWFEIVRPTAFISEAWKLLHSLAWNLRISLIFRKLMIINVKDDLSQKLVRSNHFRIGSTHAKSGMLFS